MNQLLRAALLALVFLSGSAKADVIWVGIGPQCTGFNVRNSVPDALALAEINAGPDEIRLTGTTSNLYLGPGSQLDLVDWDPATKGSLTIAGGYSDCFTSQTSVSRIGDASGPLIRVSASSGAQSVVTLQNLVISGSTSLRGLDISGSGTNVVLDNVIVEDNIAGVFVGQGATLTVGADSEIRDNFSSMTEVEFGGGIRCQGSGSRVFLSGVLRRNLALNGGNIYLGNGCFVELQQGAFIEDGTAAFGGGIYVDNFGVLEARGGASRVVIRDNFAEQGGGLYLTGASGFSTLINTLFRDNSGLIGSAIYAVNGGTNTSPRLSIDRADTCPFLISCSEFEGNRGPGPTVYAASSTIRIQRTLFDSNETTEEGVAWATIYLAGADAFINRVGFIGNETYAPIGTTGGDVLIRHVTAVGNTFPNDPGLDSWAMTVRNSFDDDVEVYNSVFADTRGHDGPPFGSFAGICNLVDNSNNWPSGTVIQGTAQFINAAGGDLRQLPSSPGVDMCNAQPGAPATDRDLEFQLVPVNEFTNPQGQPGQTGGLWDAGVDEVYSTIGDDEFTLTVARGGSGSGVVISDPLGISCGSDCSETFFQGTLVTLSATPTGGSVFTGWIGCPLPQGNQCLNTVDADRTITATFEPGESTLSVELVGTGTGFVLSSPLGISCGDICSESYPRGTEVSLTATPTGGSMFTGWINCPMPDGNQCFNTVDADRTITAVFDTEQFRLDVVKVGTGEGVVLSSPTGINCGGDCSQLYLPDTLVSLTATPDLDNLFLRWVNCPSPIGNQCQLTMAEDRMISARFEDADVIFADQFEFE